MLRELGFVQVEVTGRTGDGGVDGKGIVKVGGLLSFHVFRRDLMVLEKNTCD